jgi:uncharacterized protein (TIGR03435 family)
LISGEPAWTKKDRFEIQAELPGNSPAFTRFEFSDGEAPQLDRMLQVVLEDRFKLEVHRETRELPVYVLTVSKNGPKLKAVAAPGLRRIADGSSFKIQGLDQLETRRSENGDLVTAMGFRYTSMQGFAATLTSYVDRPILDRTGLQGNFDFTVVYDVPTANEISALGRMLAATPVMLAAIQEQLGLKLESTKSPVEVLVIDHVERPSAN